MTLFSPSNITLENIRIPVAPELKKFDGILREAMRSQVALVDLITRYIIRQKGKRVRPLLVLLSAKLCGPVNESTFRAATLIELLHSASLVHDDVVDDADTRRGFASINAVWKNKAAVLMGDYLLSRGLLLSLRDQDYYSLEATSNAVKRMSEGELLQIQKSRRLNLDEPTYLKIISDKTASLFSACTDIGAASTTPDQNKRNLLKSYGEYTGIAFQIRDDLLDYLGHTAILGKPIAGDIKDKKLTLPLIAAIHNSSRSEAHHAIHLVKKGAQKKDIEWLLDFVVKNGGIEYSLQRAKDFGIKAAECLISFPDAPEKQSLLQFIQFVIERNK